MNVETFTGSVQVSGVSAAAGRKTAGQIGKETNEHCSIFSVIRLPEVSCKVSGVPPKADQQPKSTG